MNVDDGDLRPSEHDARPLVSVVAPAYNEAGILEANLKRLAEFMDGRYSRDGWELVIVDDGSTDATGELARAFAASRENVRVRRHAANRGLGQALRSGFAGCRGRYIVVVDLDLTYAPEHIEQLLERIRASGAEIVVASPYMKGGRTTAVPFGRKLLSRWGNRFLALTALGVNRSGNLSTLTGMVRAYDGDFIRSLNLKSVGMEINTEIIYKGMILGARIEELPAHLDWSGQIQTQSVRTSSKRIRRGIVFSLLAGFTIRPFAFFIAPALLLVPVSAYSLFWAGYHTWMHYRELSPSEAPIDYAVSEAVALAFQQSPHSFIVGGITLLLAVQLFSLGILALQVKQYFEELFHFGTRVYSQARELERLAAWRSREPRSEADPDRR